VEVIGDQRHDCSTDIILGIAHAAQRNSIDLLLIGLWRASRKASAVGERAAGTTTLTRIPSRPHSRAATLESPRIASFAMAYEPNVALPSIAVLEPKFTIEPPPRDEMRIRRMHPVEGGERSAAISELDVGVRGFEEEPLIRGLCIVDQCIESAELRDRGGDGGFDVAALRDIAGDGSSLRRRMR